MSTLAKFRDVLRDIKLLAIEDNLACVLVHINDTYFIEKRNSDILGMARVAHFIKTIRKEIACSCGADRLLVVHSGDYLSPSAMSQQFKGKPMVELLKSCGLNFATIGNHEFDFHKEDPEIIWKRFAELSPCVQVIGNLEPPTGRFLPDLVFWPEENPILAITGLAGQQTIDKAVNAGFRDLNGTLDDFKTKIESIAVDLISRVRARPTVGAFVVLSHMDREEDKVLQEILNRCWDNHGFLYILGGHDHDIWWMEDDRRNAYLSKCKSNCKTITVVILPKDGLGAPFWSELPTLRLELTLEQEKRLMERVEGELDGVDEVPAELVSFVASYRGAEAADPESKGGRPPYTREELLEAVLHFYRSRLGGAASEPQLAFEKMIRVAFDSMSDFILNESVHAGEIVHDVVSSAASAARAGFSASVRSISAKEELFTLPEDREAADCVELWMQRLASEVGHSIDVITFDEKTVVSPEGMDANDASLRNHSTDFGNFIADAIRNGTGADLALINSGSFRIDLYVPGRITTGTLRDVFIYDGVGSISLLEMTKEEVRRFYEHAIKKGGHGGFLQVSKRFDEIAAETEILNVALVTHMISNKEDGYREVLAEVRGIGVEDLVGSLKRRAIDKTIVELVVQGSKSGITYSAEERIAASGNQDKLSRVIQGFIDKISSFRELTRKARIIEEDAYNILAQRMDEIPKEHVEEWKPDRLDPVTEAAGILREYLRSSLGDADRPKELRDDLLSSVEKILANHRRAFEDGVSYVRYFQMLLYPYR